MAQGVKREASRTMTCEICGKTVLERMTELEQGVGAIDETLRQRQMLLLGSAGV